MSTMDSDEESCQSLQADINAVRELLIDGCDGMRVQKIVERVTNGGGTAAEYLIAISCVLAEIAGDSPEPLLTIMTVADMARDLAMAREAMQSSH